MMVAVVRLLSHARLRIILRRRRRLAQGATEEQELFNAHILICLGRAAVWTETIFYDDHVAQLE